METEEKFCRGCYERKPKSQFPKKKSCSDGYSLICKECDRERNKQWRLANPEKEIAKTKKTAERNFI